MDFGAFRLCSVGCVDSNGECCGISSTVSFLVSPELDLEVQTVRFCRKVIYTQINHILVVGISV